MFGQGCRRDLLNTYIYKYIYVTEYKACFFNNVKKNTVFFSSPCRDSSEGCSGMYPWVLINILPTNLPAAADLKASALSKNEIRTLSSLCCPCSSLSPQRCLHHSRPWRCTTITSCNDYDGHITDSPLSLNLATSCQWPWGASSTRSTSSTRDTSGLDWWCQAYPQLRCGLQSFRFNAAVDIKKEGAVS